MTDVFTPKPFSEITAGMVEHAQASTDKLTDFNVGSVVRSLLEANAVELDDYYQAVHAGLLKAIPTAIYLGFGFDRRPALAATGSMRFDNPGESPVVIPALTEMTAMSGARYATREEVAVPAGGHAFVVVAALVPGIAGNADPETVTTEFGGATGSNPALIAGGADAETEGQRAERFAAFIRALARGTVAALEYGCTLPVLTHPVTGVAVERVQRASVFETPGHVDLFIHNGAFGASDALIAAVQSEIDGYREGGVWHGGWRPAGMRVDVQALQETPVDVSMELAGAPTLAVRGAVERLLRAAMPRQRIRPIDLVNAALSVDGVLGATVMSPTQALVVPDFAILYLDNWSAEWAE